jgi:hypothetical protein
MRIALLLAFATVAACDGAEPVSAQRRAVIEGTPSPAEGNVVSLFAAGRLRCSGVIVSDRVVLSAAHCGVEGGPDLVRFDGSWSDEGARADVVYWRAADAFEPRAVPEADLAVAIAAPGSFPDDRRAVLPPRDLIIHAGDVVRIAGFGDNPADPVRTPKTQGPATVLRTEGTKIWLAPMPAHACSGDSGGPVFLERDGVEYLVGVTSAGETSCEEEWTATAVSALREFVEAMLALSTSTGSPTGAECADGAGCASARCVPAGLRRKVCGMSCAGGCPGGWRCEADACVPALPPGSPGTACRASGECDDYVCAADVIGHPKTCTRACSPTDKNACPAAARCAAALDAPSPFACLPPAASGGCSLEPGRASPAPWLLVLILLAMRRRARR